MGGAGGGRGVCIATAGGGCPAREKFHRGAEGAERSVSGGVGILGPLHAICEVVAMLTNAFIGKREAPTGAELSAELGGSKKLWDQLVDELTREFELEAEGWSSYSPKAGWAFRLKRGKRRIVYLSPARGCFLASLVLGDKAVAAAPRAVIKRIADGTRYPEGTAVRVEVKAARDLGTVKKLVAVKVAW